MKLNLNLSKDKEQTDEENRKFDFKESMFFKTVSSNLKTFFILMCFLQFNVILGQLFLKKSNTILSLIIAIGAIIFLLLFKDTNDEVSDSFKLSALKIAFLLSITIFVNQMITDLLMSLTDNKLTSILNILFLFDIAILIGSFGFNQQEGVQDFFDKLIAVNCFNKSNSKDNYKIKLGDAVLGNNVDENDKVTDTPVVIPLKDRFLHTLIIGPTGCGKTSQTIIPFINRDMTDKELGIIALEPKGDLAEQVFAMGKYYKRESLYFNPILPDCPYFNPLYGKENDVIENMATTFNMLNADSQQYFKDMNEQLIRKSVKLLKRLLDNDATLIDLNTLVWDTGGQGRKMVLEFSRIKNSNPDTQKENDEIFQWFMNDYYSGTSGGKGGTKTYDNCSGIRTQISKLVSNEYLRKVLNPPQGHGSDIDFDKILEEGTVMAISTSQGALGDLGRFLGYFIILQLQASVFRRPGNENTRRPCMLYIDEFQEYANPGFGRMLTQGRSYRVASHLATQAREQIGMNSGKGAKAFIQLVSSNARNKIIYPGISPDDAKYYSEEFGEKTVIKEGKTYAKKRFFSTLTEQRVSTSVKEETEKRFSLTDLVYRKFKYVTYATIFNNSVQTPGVAKIDFIPQDLYKIISKMVDDYNNEQIEKNNKVKEMMEANKNEKFGMDKLNSQFNDASVNNSVGVPSPTITNSSTVPSPLSGSFVKSSASQYSSRPVKASKVNRSTISNNNNINNIDNIPSQMPNIPQSMKSNSFLDDDVIFGNSDDYSYSDDQNDNGDNDIENNTQNNDNSLNELVNDVGSDINMDEEYDEDDLI